MQSTSLIDLFVLCKSTNGSLVVEQQESLSSEIDLVGRTKDDAKSAGKLSIL